LKPVLLRLQAFGPYLEQQTVNFHALEDFAFFIIQGPTGSGKSSILDAICFALYGAASNSEKSEKVFRSDKADPKMETFVTLEFEVHQKRYRVTRSPAYEKQKQRGEGTTTSNPTASLEDVTELPVDSNKPGKVMTPAKISEVTKKIEEILGFNIKQFRQVIVLPQNEFRKALLSTSQERASILEILFQASQYKQLEFRLKEKLNELKEDLKKQLTQIDTILGTVECVSAQDIESKLKALKVELEALNKDLKKANDELKKVEAEYNKQATVFQQFEELERLQKGLSELESKKEDVENTKQEIQRFDFFAKNESDLNQIRKNQENIESIKASLQTTKSKIEELEKQSIKFEHQQKQIDQVLNKRNEYHEEINLLKSLVEKDKELQSLSKKESDKTDSLDEAIKKLSENESKLSEAIKEQKAIRQLLAAEPEIISRKHELDKKLDELNKQQQSFKKAESINNLINEHKSKLAKEKDQLQKLSSSENELKVQITSFQEKLNQNKAASLAIKLEENKPCPVCGSIHHPEPAKAHDAQINPNELKEKEKQLEITANHISKLNLDINSLEKDIDALSEKLTESQSDTASFKLADIIKDLKAQEIEQKNIAQKLSNIQKAKQDVQSIESLVAKLTEQKSDYTAIITKLETNLEELQKQIQKLTNDLDKHDQYKLSYTEKLENLSYKLQKAENEEGNIRSKISENKEQIISTKSRYEHLESDLKKSEKLIRDLTASLGKKIESSPFNSFDQLLDYYSDPKQNEHHIKQVENYQYQLRQTKEKISELSTKLENIQKPDMEVLTKQKEEKAQKKDNVISEISNLTSRQKQYKGALENISALKKESSEQQSLYEKYQFLSGIASGDYKENPTKIKFHEFVLQAQLDEVLECATQRLRILSKQRYELRRNQDDYSSGQKSTALDLIIDDYMTGKSRPVSTLSGGELFLASLSLALGLADVVQQYSGGIELSTLFIDEGFGSLDPESLDLVIEALMELQKGNKMIGIISHVEELKRRIDVQLEIVPPTHQRGAEIRTILP